MTHAHFSPCSQPPAELEVQAEKIHRQKDESRGKTVRGDQVSFLRHWRLLTFLFDARIYWYSLILQFKFWWREGRRGHEWEEGGETGRGGGEWGGRDGEETGRAESWRGGWAQTVCHGITLIVFTPSFMCICSICLLIETGVSKYYRFVFSQFRKYYISLY